MEIATMVDIKSLKTKQGCLALLCVLSVVAGHTDRGFEMVFACQLAYRLWRAAQPAPDWKYAAHHLLSLSIPIGLYFNESLSTGVLIGLVHDLSELAVVGVKLARHGRGTLALWYPTLLASWFFGRLVAFPYMIAQVVETPATKYMLWPLVVLHGLWFVEILQAGYRHFLK